MQHKNLDKPLTHLFMHIGKLLNDELRRALGEGGIHFGQARVLLVLLDYDELSQSVLGRGLHIKPASVTNLVKKMEDSGLISRRQDVDDDRIMNVSLTPKGRDAANFTVGVMQKTERTVCSRLSQKEIDTIRKPLESVRDSLGGLAPTL